MDLCLFLGGVFYQLETKRVSDIVYLGLVLPSPPVGMLNLKKFADFFGISQYDHSSHKRNSIQMCVFTSADEVRG